MLFLHFHVAVCKSYEIELLLAGLRCHFSFPLPHDEEERRVKVAPVVDSRAEFSIELPHTGEFLEKLFVDLFL